jgi:hypothetical protein
MEELALHQGLGQMLVGMYVTTCIQQGLPAREVISDVEALTKNAPTPLLVRGLEGVHVWGEGVRS